MSKEANAVGSAEAAVRKVFKEMDEEWIAARELEELVMERSSVGQRNVRLAIRTLTDVKREGRAYFRRRKVPKMGKRE